MYIAGYSSGVSDVIVAGVSDVVILFQQGSSSEHYESIALSISNSGSRRDSGQNSFNAAIPFRFTRVLVDGSLKMNFSTHTPSFVSFALIYRRKKYNHNVGLLIF